MSVKFNIEIESLCYVFLRDDLVHIFDFVQGLENSWENHKKCVAMLHEGLEKLGLELLVKDKVSNFI